MCVYIKIYIFIFNKWKTRQRIPVSRSNLNLYGKYGLKQVN